MSITQLRPDIRYVGVNDRTTNLFESLWTLPHAVSYNSYLVVGEKIALIDTVEEHFTSRLLSNIRHEIGDRNIDYIIVNHMEPDHSSSIAALSRIYPDLKVVGNMQTIRMLEGYYGITENTVTVKEGDTIDLGNGKVLSFYLTPMVHWPETMVTWCEDDKTLFAGDAFGSFGALDGGISDKHLKFADYENEMRRYYAAIVGKYGPQVQKALAKVNTLAPEMICSTHGPVWENSVAEVIDIYDRMSRYEAENGVVIAYGSMYGNTEQMAEEIARGLAEEGVENILVYNLATTDPSVVLRDVFRYNSLIVGSPTYNAELFPPVAHFLNALAMRDIKQRHFAAFGSFTWANSATKALKEFAEKMKWEPVVPVQEMKQGYSEEKCAAPAREIAHAIAEKLKA